MTRGEALSVARWFRATVEGYASAIERHGHPDIAAALRASADESARFFEDAWVKASEGAP